MRRRALRECLLRAGASPRRVRYDQIETLDTLLASGKTGGRVRFADGFEARVDRHALVIARAVSEPRAATAPVPLRIPGVTTLDVPPGEPIGFDCDIVPREAMHEPLSAGQGGLAHVDFDITGPALFIRFRRTGDRLRPLGGPGRRKLSDLLIDAAVPGALRDRLPLLVRPGAGRRDPAAGDMIVWVAGVRIAEEFKVTGSTSRVLRIRLGGVKTGW
jgi:tRNA(Ile)-lysidine synthase